MKLHTTITTRNFCDACKYRMTSYERINHGDGYPPQEVMVFYCEKTSEELPDEMEACPIYQDELAKQPAMCQTCTLLEIEKPTCRIKKGIYPVELFCGLEGDCILRKKGVIV